MENIGKKDWAFSSGRIPFHSNGEEPEFVSHDKVAILNTNNQDAEIEIFVFYEDESPVSFKEIKVEPQRLKKIRFNDLIDPTAMKLERNYSCFIQSNINVVIQFSRLNTGIAENAEMSTMAFPVDT